MKAFWRAGVQPSWRYLTGTLSKAGRSSAATGMRVSAGSLRRVMRALLTDGRAGMGQEGGCRKGK